MKSLISITTILILLLTVNTFSQLSNKGSTSFYHTFSIVARDSLTGEMGVAVQSHWFSVGSVVSWGEPGVGVVATQSFVNVSFGIRGLELLKNGKTPQQSVDELLASDEGREFRQVAILDTNGNTAAFTGKNCVEFASHITGKNYSVQSNLMINNRVCPAMEKAFLEASGPLAERMMAALEAGQEAGGDIRGRQSSSIVVFRAKSTGKPWEDRLIDLRVEDSPEPIKELSRLLKVFRAYEHMNNGDLATERGDNEAALKEYSAAEEMFPDNLEMKYWHAVMLVNSKRIEDAVPMFKEIFSKDENWRTLTPRLVKPGLLNVSDKELEYIINIK